MKTSLVIMAAGMGSRYGGGIKQLEKVGPHGEIIMDYSIYDAKEAGFDKVIFIIRKDIEQSFREVIGDRISKVIDVEYCYQNVNDLPDGFSCPEGRTKPWGTGQAVLSCFGRIEEPFAVINADDYYGKEAFGKLHTFLCAAGEAKTKAAYCMAGFVLGNTLSENGAVTRGVCKVDQNNRLLQVEETYGLVKSGTAAVGKNGDGEKVIVPLDTPVSMNMWGFTGDFLFELQAGFTEFLSNLGDGALTKEYLLPGMVGHMVQEGRATVDVLSTQDKWFGVTYQEDKEAVVRSIAALTDSGKYPGGGLY